LSRGTEGAERGRGLARSTPGRAWREELELARIMEKWGGASPVSGRSREERGLRHGGAVRSVPEEEVGRERGGARARPRRGGARPRARKK